MTVKEVVSSEQGPHHVTPAGRSIFCDLFPAEKVAKMEMRAQLLMGLQYWFERSRMTQAEAAKVLGTTQARVSDLKLGKIDKFSMDLLARLAARAGLMPKLKLAAAVRCPHAPAKDNPLRRNAWQWGHSDSMAAASQCLSD